MGADFVLSMKLKADAGEFRAGVGSAADAVKGLGRDVAATTVATEAVGRATATAGKTMGDAAVGAHGLADGGEAIATAMAGAGAAASALTDGTTRLSSITDTASRATDTAGKAMAATSADARRLAEDGAEVTGNWARSATSMSGAAGAASNLTRGAGALADGTAKLSSATAGASTSWVRGEKDLLALDARLVGHISQVDRTYKVTKLLDDAQTDFDEGVRLGLVSQTKAAEVMGLLRSRYQEVTPAVHAGADAVGLQANQITNLGYQIQDIGVSLAGGQSPFLVLVQQVPQAVSAVGGLRNAMSLLGGILTPVTIGLTATVAVLAIGAARAIAMADDVRELPVRLQVLNRGDLSADGLRAEAYRAAEAEGSGGRSTSVAAVSELAGSMDVAAGTMAQALDLSRQLGAAMGKDAAEGAKSLTEALSGGIDGVRKLAQANGGLSLETLTTVQHLYEQGRSADAAKLAIEGLGERLKDVAENKADALDKVLTKLRSGLNAVADAAAAPWRTATFEDDAKAAEAEYQRVVLARGQWFGISPLASDAVLADVKARAETARRIANATAAPDSRHGQDMSPQDIAASDAAAQMTDELATRRRVDAFNPALRSEMSARLRPLTGKSPTEGIDNEKDAAMARQSRETAARDAVVDADLQAAAQERLTRAAGSSADAVRRVGVENQIAAFSHRHAGEAAQDHAARAWRLFEAQEAQRTAEWARGIDDGVAATIRLTEATWRGAEALAAQQEQEKIEAAVLVQGEQARAKITEKIHEETAARVDNARSGIALEIAQNGQLVGALSNGQAAYEKTRKAQDLVKQGFTEKEAASLADGWWKSTKAVQNASTAVHDYAQQQRSTLDLMKSQWSSFDAFDAMAGKQRQSMDAILEQARATQAAELEDYRQTLEAKGLSADEFARRMEAKFRQNEQELNQIAKDAAKYRAEQEWGAGAQSAFVNYFAGLKQHGKLAGEFLTNSVFRPLEGTLSNFFKTGEMSFKTFKEAVVSGMSDLAAKLVMSGASSMASGVVKSIGEAVGASTAGQYVKSLFAADGGYIRGPGGPTDDRVAAWLSNGEYVVNAGKTAEWRPVLDAINFGGLAPADMGLRFAHGGAVGDQQYGDDGMPRMGFGGFFKSVSNAVSSVVKTVSNVVSSVGDVVGSVAEGAFNAVKGSFSSPLGLASLAMILIAPQLLPAITGSIGAAASVYSADLIASSSVLANMGTLGLSGTLGAVGTGVASSFSAGLLGSATSMSLIAQSLGTSLTTSAILGGLGIGGGGEGLMGAVIQKYLPGLADPTAVVLAQMGQGLSGLLQSRFDPFAQSMVNAAGTAKVDAQGVADRGAAFRLPGLATGGAAGPGAFIAGERGPELIVSPAPTRVFNATDTTRMLAGGSGATDQLGQLADLLRALLAAGDRSTMVDAEIATAILERLDAIDRRLAAVQSQARLQGAAPRVAA